MLDDSDFRRKKAFAIVFVAGGLIVLWLLIVESRRLEQAVAEEGRTLRMLIDQEQGIKGRGKP